MSAGFVRKAVGQAGSCVGGCSALRDFAIEYAQRIGVDTASAIFTKLSFLLFEVFDELRTIEVAVGGIAQIIDFERQRDDFTSFKEADDLAALPHHLSEICRILKIEQPKFETI